MWIMVPARKLVDDILTSLTPKLSAGDIAIDGGNSFYKDSIDRAKKLKEQKVHFIDAGTSGGIWGLEALSLAFTLRQQMM